MNRKQKALLSKVDKKILSQEKIIKKLKKYPNHKTKISFLDLVNIEIENKKLVAAYEKYSQLSELVKIVKTIRG